VTETAAAEAMPASHEPEPIVTAALTDPSEMLPPENSPEQVAKSVATPEPARPIRLSTRPNFSTSAASQIPASTVTLAALPRTPKEDAVKTQEKRKSDRQEKGQAGDCHQTFTTVADEIFRGRTPRPPKRPASPWWIT